jgi:hypothetical protein
MLTEQEDIGITVYAPALVGNDSRPLNVVLGMERTLPGLCLGWTTSGKDDLIALPHRDEWFTAHLTHGGFPFLCNDDDDHLVTVAGRENPNGLAARSPPHLEVNATLLVDAVGLAAVVDVLEALADGARAFWGHATPADAALEISRQTRDPVRKPGVPPRGLPALKFSDSIRAPEIPHCLGWMNYWSAASAQALGFPDQTRDAELLSRSRRTATGGWIVQLTKAPLDLDNPAHLEALLRTYERFPRIGGRSSD